MFVWTEKAEEAYRARHPHRKNERKAGTLVTWEGQELQSGTILQGYQSRGWVKYIEPKPIRVDVKPRKHVKRHVMTNPEKRQRWYKIAYYLSQPEKLSISQIAMKLGYSSHNVVDDFVRNYGEELSAKYGKLPYREGMKASYWHKVMEVE